MASRMEVQNVNHPGQVRHVNGAIYARVKQAMLAHRDAGRSVRRHAPAR